MNKHGTAHILPLAFMLCVLMAALPLEANPAPPGVVPADPEQTECVLKCNWEGYRIRVIVPSGMTPEVGARILEVNKVRRLQYGNASLVIAQFGRIDPLYEVADVTLVAKSATVDDKLCNNEGLPLKGRVYKIQWPNDLNFESGRTPTLSLGAGACAEGLEYLRQKYNAYADPKVPIPRCRKAAQGCRDYEPPPPTDDTGIGPRGHVPAEFESADERDDAHRIISRSEWTEWMNRDGPGGSGDYETLRDFRKDGLDCAKVVDIQCQTVDGVNWRETGEVYSCDPTQGGVCVNREQEDDACEDYRVRMLCEMDSPFAGFEP